jgi:hypothetical protein
MTTHWSALIAAALAALTLSACDDGADPCDDVECGEHGACDPDAGACVCDVGYDPIEGEGCLQEPLATFDDLGLDPGSFWNGADGAGSFRSGDATFLNAYSAEYSSWDGFASSTMTDTATAGVGNQYSAIAGGGAGGSEAYGVAYQSAFSSIGPPTLEIEGAGDEGVELSGVWVTNTTYTYLAMRDGDAYSKQFGGEAGDDPDFFLLSITGLAPGGGETGPVELYLADYRADDPSDDVLVDDWTWLDLSALGPVTGLRFELSSSDMGEYGMNTPAYFAIDRLMRHGQ